MNKTKLLFILVSRIDQIFMRVAIKLAGFISDNDNLIKFVIYWKVMRQTGRDLARLKPYLTI